MALKIKSQRAMSQQLSSAVQAFIDEASFEDLFRVKQYMSQRMSNLVKPQQEVQKLCEQKGWLFRWYPHPSIPNTVFLQIRFDGDYQEFVGYHQLAPKAYNAAAERALEYFCVKSRKRKYSEMQMELAEDVLCEN